MDPVRALGGEITLRPLTIADAVTLATWSRDEEFCRAADWSLGKSLDEHQAFHRRIVAEPPADLIRLGARWRGRLVGYADLHGDETDRRELGFLIGPAFWGRGLGGATAASALEFGFDRLGLREVWAEAADANPRSIRILQRCGMREVGRGDDVTYRDVPTFYRRFSLVVPSSTPGQSLSRH